MRPPRIVVTVIIVLVALGGLVTGLVLARLGTLEGEKENLQRIVDRQDVACPDTMELTNTLWHCDMMEAEVYEDLMTCEENLQTCERELEIDLERAQELPE